MATSGLEDFFDLVWRINAPPGTPEPEAEYRFTKPRKWRFDRAWPDRKVAVELEGGVWQQGRHVRAQGFAADCAKYNHAIVEGWRVLRYTSDMLYDNPEAVVLQVVEVLMNTKPARAGKGTPNVPVKPRRHPVANGTP